MSIVSTFRGNVQPISINTLKFVIHIYQPLSITRDSCIATTRATWSEQIYPRFDMETFTASFETGLSVLNVLLSSTDLVLFKIRNCFIYEPTVHYNLIPFRFN